jgi:hypothetical protein
LAQALFLALGTNRLTQKAAVLHNQHDQPKKREARDGTMPLTTIFH